MERLPRQSSPRGEPLPYKPPSNGDRLFYLLLTVTASTVVYKSFPKSLRGIATIGVASFGIYHTLGFNCDCIKRVVSNIFGGFPGGSDGSSGGYGGWGCFSTFPPNFPLPWETGRPPSSHTGSVDQGRRQEKRERDPHRKWEEDQSRLSSSPFPFSTPPSHTGGMGRGGLTRSPYSPSSHSASFPSVRAVDTGERQGKRTGGRGSSREEEKRRSSSPQRREPTSFSSPHSFTVSVDSGERQQKRSGQTGSEQQDW